MLSIVPDRLNVDTERVFIARSSQGRYHESLLGAGRYAVDRKPPSMESIRGKPIFIGAHEHDSHTPLARDAARIYRSWGADVAYEEWPGELEFSPKGLLNWLENI